jgi:hypothetical protein
VCVAIVTGPRWGVCRELRKDESVQKSLILSPEEWDVEELERWGAVLDHRPASLRGRTVAMALAEQILVVRTRDGKGAPLRANAVQRAFEERRGERNIVLKARQLGLTTWVGCA